MAKEEWEGPPPAREESSSTSKACPFTNATMLQGEAMSAETVHVLAWSFSLTSW
jgi:hypothetical protein